jgi:hypothetical protein
MGELPDDFICSYQSLKGARRFARWLYVDLLVYWLAQSF